MAFAFDDARYRRLIADALAAARDAAAAPTDAPLASPPGPSTPARRRPAPAAPASPASALRAQQYQRAFLSMQPAVAGAADGASVLSDVTMATERHVVDDGVEAAGHGRSTPSPPLEPRAASAGAVRDGDRPAAPLRHHSDASTTTVDPSPRQRAASLPRAPTPRTVDLSFWLGSGDSTGAANTSGGSALAAVAWREDAHGELRVLPPPSAGSLDDSWQAAGLGAAAPPTASLFSSAPPTVQPSALDTTASAIARHAEGMREIDAALGRQADLLARIRAIARRGLGVPSNSSAPAAVGFAARFADASVPWVAETGGSGNSGVAGGDVDLGDGRPAGAPQHTQRASPPLAPSPPPISSQHRGSSGAVDDSDEVVDAPPATPPRQPAPTGASAPPLGTPAPAPQPAQPPTPHSSSSGEWTAADASFAASRATLRRAVALLDKLVALGAIAAVAGGQPSAPPPPSSAVPARARVPRAPGGQPTHSGSSAEAPSHGSSAPPAPGPLSPTHSRGRLPRPPSADSSGSSGGGGRRL